MIFVHSIVTDLFLTLLYCQSINPAKYYGTIGIQYQVWNNSFTLSLSLSLSLSPNPLRTLIATSILNCMLSVNLIIQFLFSS